ncbi:MAG: rhamnulokinase [Clostridiales bacterium]|jgi:rhamnulokinase|nr:rhamnulokinase [Clostridiales bacterium]
MRYFCAIDIGASNGRHALGHISEGKLIIEEIHRFPNDFIKRSGRFVWDTGMLYAEIIKGLKRCAELGKTPMSAGIDTWGVDYVLLDSAGSLLGDAVAYRDLRVNGMDEHVFKLISERELYARTGTQKLAFNTIFQLMAQKLAGGFENAAALLTVPDYLHYLLSGIMKTEYTVASTTGLLNAHTREWDWGIISACGYPDVFQEIVPPGTVLGPLRSSAREALGFDCAVITPASHDTASAVMALPSAVEAPMYISSGTWSLMGVLRGSPGCDEQSRRHNFTNEGGCGNIRYLKNLMGLWMIQRVRKELNDEYSYARLCEMAEQESIESIVDCDDSVFLAPDSMIEAIKGVCERTGQKRPETAGELAAVVYNSLAARYRQTVDEIELLTREHYGGIYIVGGGSNADYLNRLTARYTGKTVYAGPSEAAAAGNLLAQMIAMGELPDLDAGRRLIRESFDIKIFKPE